MPRRMSTIVETAPQLIASATLHVDTPGVGFVEITENAINFVKQAGAGEGVLLIYLRHTSASLTIQEMPIPTFKRTWLLRSTGSRLRTRRGSTIPKGLTICRRMSRQCSMAFRCRCLSSPASWRSEPGRASTLWSIGAGRTAARSCSSSSAAGNRR